LGEAFQENGVPEIHHGYSGHRAGIKTKDNNNLFVNVQQETEKCSDRIICHLAKEGDSCYKYESH
jgi:hypothetical protein